MDLGCPLLRGSSDPRLRRCAATLPSLLERTFPGSTFFSAFVEVMAAVRDSVIGPRSSGVHLRIQTFRPGEMSSRPSWLVFRVESVVVSCGMRRFATVIRTDIYGWC